jgi:DNA gyrase inhibitor GyrI
VQTIREGLGEGDEEVVGKRVEGGRYALTDVSGRTGVAT